MKTKVCSKCGNEKSYDNDFLWRNKKKGLKHSQCSLCYKETRKSSYGNNRQYYYERNLKKRKQSTDWLVEYKKNKKCYFCNETEPICLDFHHIDDTKKEFNISNMKYQSTERMKKEIEKCVIVCSNCHRKIHTHLLKI
jgi:hypothetical protein